MEVISKPWLGHPYGHGFLGFKTVTMVPFEPKLIDLKLLSVQHVSYWIKYTASNIICNRVNVEMTKDTYMRY